MVPNKTSKFEELVEKYRFWIGGVLILAIVGGSAVLIWRENYKMPSLEGRIKNLELRITELEQEQKISKLELQISNINSNENSNIQTEQGIVAGTTSNNSDNSEILNTSLPAGRQVQDDNNKTGKININTATAAELDTLSGVGPVTAKNIIDYRTQKGPFKTIDELDNVVGIGKKTIDKFRDKITI